MNTTPEVAGLAALAICESILLSLTENNVIDDAEARAILEDAAAAHRNAMSLTADGDGKDHEAAAVLIERLLQGGNSVRRT
jgi:hypothetical protein